MTSTIDVDAPPVQAHVILRDGEWVGLYDLSTSGAVDDLRKHCCGAYYSDEAIGDAWMLADFGAPEPLIARSSTTAFDDEDWAMCTVAFVRAANAQVVVELTFRVDGRA